MAAKKRSRKGGALSRVWQDAGREGEVPKAKRVRTSRPKAKKAGRLVAVKCNALRLVEAAIRSHAPGLQSLELMGTMRSGFATFVSKEQADAAIQKGGFSIASEPVTLQRAKQGDVFVALNVKRILLNVLQAEYPGLVKVSWNPTLTYAVVDFKHSAEEQRAVQRGASLLFGQPVHVSDQLYDTVLPDVHAQEIVFKVLQSQFPGLLSVKWSEDHASAELRFRADEDVRQAAAQGAVKMRGVPAKVVPLSELGARADRTEKN